MLLAQITDPTGYQAIGWVIVAIAAAAVAIKQIIGLVKELRGKDPQPPNETLGQRMATVERDIDGLKDDVREVDQKITSFARDGDESRAKLHNRVDEILAAVSELRGEMKARRH